MPSLVYTSSGFPFTPFTKILSGDMNQCFTDIKTLLNTTKLDASNLQDLGVTTAKIANGAVGTTQLADTSVSTAKLIDGSVTPAKKAALGQQISLSSGGYFTTSTSLTDVTNLTVTITTTGRPVMLKLQPDGVGTAEMSCLGVANATSVVSTRFVRGSTAIADFVQYLLPSNFGGVNHGIAVPSSVISHIDTPVAGTYTYKVQVATSASMQLNVLNTVLVAFEL